MSYPHGLFSWADVSSPDPQAGAQFYSELFGWDAQDQHDPDGSYIYTLFFKDGKQVAGLGPLPQEMQDAGVPPAWSNYVTVDDVDAMAAAVTSNGGTVQAIMDVMSSGRMAIVSDPTGAMLMLWQAGESVGGEIFQGHGTMSWNELATRDMAKAQSFYGEVLPWRFEDAPGLSGYQLVMLDSKEDGQPYMADTFNGGMLTMDETWPAEMPPHWMVYFTVDNVDELVARLSGLGGEAAVPAFDTPNGRIAVVRDPHGAVFSIIAPSQAVAPDEG